MPADVYRSGRAFLVTLVIDGRRPLLAPGSAAASELHALLERGWPDSTHYAWVIMPDHLHALITSTDVLRWVTRFKALSRRAVAARLWQRSFHDRMLRRHDACSDVARYIWLNPLRAGLVERAAHYPGSGSNVWPDWRDWVDAP